MEFLLHRIELTSLENHAMSTPRSSYKGRQTLGRQQHCLNGLASRDLETF